MSNTIIIGVLIGTVLLGVFGAIVPLVLISFLAFRVGTALLRGRRRLSPRGHLAKRLKA